MARKLEERFPDAGKRLEAERKASNKTQKAFVNDEEWKKIVRVSDPSTLSDWEREGIPESKIKLVAKFLKISVEELKGDEQMDNDLKNNDCSKMGYPSHEEIIPRQWLYESKKRLPNEVFASELLVKPIHLLKKEDRIRIIIDRNDVKCVIISQKARREICETFLKGKEESLRKKEKEIQEFINGKSEANDLSLYLNELPLRWASGGVLSVINFRGKKYMPFFFRDIQPYGWNMVLGSSERHFDKNDNLIDDIDQELNRPWYFILREFIEETSILDVSPYKSKEPFCKEFYFSDMDVQRTMELTGKSLKRYIKLRRDYDNISINKSDKFIDRFRIRADISKTDTDVEIYYKDITQPLTTNILISFNLLELGIEVIKVVEYSLADDDYILNGEVLNKDGFEELVRMPAGLISCEYLEKEFGKDYDPNKLTYGIEPSYKVSSPIPAEEFYLFDWDIIQRVKIIKGEKQGIGSERKRYTTWYNAEDILKIKEYFLDENDNPRHDNPCPLFTPATAKILNSFFTKKIAGKIRIDS